MIILNDCGALGDMTTDSNARPLFSPVRPSGLFVHSPLIAHPSPARPFFVGSSFARVDIHSWLTSFDEFWPSPQVVLKLECGT